MFGKKAAENAITVVEGRGTPYLLILKNGKWGLEFSDLGVQVWFDSETMARKNYSNKREEWKRSQGLHNNPYFK